MSGASCPFSVMAGFKPVTHPARLGAPKRVFRSRTLAQWVAGSSVAMTNGEISGL